MSGLAGKFDGSVQVIDGYMQISTVSGTPDPNACNSAGQAGRMTVDGANSKLWICTGAGGWKYAALN